MITPGRLVALLSIALPLAPPSEAQAQDDQGRVSAVAVVQDPAPPGGLALGDDIVVTGRRYGEAEIAAESEFDEDEIASQGADSIQDLITRLTPFIGDGAEEPILLINGRPADGDRSIRSYPAEALSRLAVLKPEAAAQYGYASGKRVVNLVLKKSFSSLNADMDISAATAGGQYGGSLSAGRVAINGETRWNVKARIERQSNLLKSDRNIPPSPGSFDRVGFIAGADGGEIDPTLSEANGEVVTIAAVPLRAMTGFPTLEDFTTTENVRHAVDPDDFETLLSARRNMSLNIGITRPLGDFSASLNVNASSNSSHGQRGLPMASIIVPADSPWSPFASDVALFRPFSGTRALRNDNSSQSVGAAFNLSGRIGEWQTNFSFNYARNWGDNLFESGIDTDQLQDLIDVGDPATNPYGPLDSRLLLATRNRSLGENFNTRFNVRKTIIELPAGPLTSNFSLDVRRNRSKNRRSDNHGGVIEVNERVRGETNGQMSFNVPLSRREDGAIRPLGDLALDLSVSGQTISNSSLQKRFGGGVSWSPFPFLEFRGALEYWETAPSFDQVIGPVLTTVNRIFDYRQQETTEIIMTIGGNPDLGRGSRDNRSLTAIVRPFNDQTLSLNVSYRQEQATGGVAAFPELTPVIEAVFPERVTRDANGRLVAIDARAINIANETSTELNSSIALRLPSPSGAKRSAKPRKPGSHPLRFTISLNHRWRLKRDLLTRVGVPVIDLLSGSGQSRHYLSFQVSAGKRGIGTSLNGSWSSAARVRNGGNDDIAQDFISKPPAIFDFSFFVEPEHILSDVREFQWLKDVKLSLDVKNILNGYRRITLGRGNIPDGFSRDEIDPLGRTAQLSIRKKF